MDRFGRSGAMHSYTLESLKRALFEQGEFEMYPSPTYTDEDKDWNDPANLGGQPELFSSPGWTWQNAETIVEATLWPRTPQLIASNPPANTTIPPLTPYPRP